MKQFINLTKMGLTAFFIMAGVILAIVYLAGSIAWAGTNPVIKEISARPDGKQAVDNKTAEKTAIVPLETEFVKVTEKCTQCHQGQFSSTDNLKKIKWVVPGKPEVSPVYKVIGKNKKPNGTYHNLTTTEKATINDYIKNLK